MSGVVGRLARAWRACAAPAVTLLVLFFAANAAALVDIRLRRAGPFTRAVKRHGLARVLAAHTELAAADVAEFRREIDRPLEYEPFTEARPSPSSGRFVNVDPHGFRRVDAQRPWPPPPGARTVFVFGGSTTYGLLLPDRETIPSHVQAFLAAEGKRGVQVYNFGRPSAGSTEERILFEQLLALGHRPEVAVFIDGRGEWRDVDGPRGVYPFQGARSESLRGLVEDVESTSVSGQLTALARALPLSKWLASRSRRGRRAFDAAAAGRAADRWLVNARLSAASARSFGVRPLFVWEPLGPHGRPAAVRSRAEIGYEEMARRRALGALPDVLWLADPAAPVAGAADPEEVPTAASSRSIAAAIARALPLD